MKIAIVKKQDDSMAVRISIGGFKMVGNNGYITYRGDLDSVKLLLANAIAALNKLEKEPEISPDDGKNYA
jgi:hypothetical protein